MTPYYTQHKTTGEEIPIGIDEDGAVDLSECDSRCRCGACAVCGHQKHSAIHGPSYGQAAAEKINEQWTDDACYHKEFIDRDVPIIQSAIDAATAELAENERLRADAEKWREHGRMMQQSAIYCAIVAGSREVAAVHEADIAAKAEAALTKLLEFVEACRPSTYPPWREFELRDMAAIITAAFTPSAEGL